jgi:hypothetical protein
MRKNNLIKSILVLCVLSLATLTACKKETVTPTPTPVVEDTDFQFTTTFNGSTYTFKDKTFNEQGLLEGFNLGALCKTFQDTTAMLLSGVNAAKDDTLNIYFMDKTGASKSFSAIGNTTFPLVNPNAGEPSKYIKLTTSKNSEEFTCVQSGDNFTLTVTKSDEYSATSAIKGTFTGKVSSFNGSNKQYTLSGSFRARKVKD